MVDVRASAGVIIAGVFAAAACSVFYHNGSFDMGLHYALISHLFDADCQPIYFMCEYPPAAHFLAAVLGRLLGSPFLGMILISSAAVFTLYAGLLSLMRMPDRAATAVALCIFCTICILGSGRRLPLFGNEIRGNFFYGQLVGTAVMLAFVAIERKLNPVLSLFAVMVLGWFYPISAVQLAGAVIASMLLQSRPLWLVAAFAVASAAAVRFHPLFKKSAALANNDGDIATGWIPVNWIIPLAVMLILVAAYLAWHRSNTPLVSLAFGFAGAAIIQWLALDLLHLGSPYIVTKHMFGIVTSLIATVSVVIAMNVDPPKLSLSPWALPICAVICTVAVLPPSDRSTAAFVRAEKGGVEPEDARDQFALEVGERGIPIFEALKRHGL